MAHADPEHLAAGPRPLMEAVLQPGNLKKALARVRRHRGAPGGDDMTVGDLGAHLRSHWPEIGSRLLDGAYEPQPVRRVEIPKASGGVRPLGVPTVLDRFIQQAVMQVLQEDWDGTFSDASYGFRPGRSAHQAIERAPEHIRVGRATCSMSISGSPSAGTIATFQRNGRPPCGWQTIACSDSSAAL